MSKIHILTGSNSGIFTAIVHIATPVGNNAAGTLWSDAIKNSGRNISRMKVGTGAGQILQAELDQITAGTLIEGTFQWQDDPALNNTQRVADLSLRATQMTNDLLARYAIELNYFGYAGS